MNIEEARTVLWLKSNHRPLGELLDDGYLTQERLEWAAKWAYNPRLQEAAKVLLETIIHPSTNDEVVEKPETLIINTGDSAIETNISFDKASSTAWPFPPYKGQMMGRLVESRQLSLKDLAYAVENAWDERVRRAATTFSLIRLKQVIQEPAPSAGFIHVVSGGRSFAQQKETQLTLLLGIFFGVIASGTAFFLFRSIRPATERNPNAASLGDLISTPSGVFGLIIALGIILFIGWLVSFVIERITKRLENQIEAHRRGQEGEDSVVQVIVQALDGNWHLFRNVSIPGRNKADLDVVLVGPPGVWALEVKNFNGTYRNHGDAWEYKKGSRWRTMSKNPSRQANNASLRLANFLKADHLKVFVNSVVVWASITSPLFIDNPSVSIWYYRRLADELGNIWQGERLSKIERDKIIDKLTRLCKHQYNTIKPKRETL